MPLSLTDAASIRDSAVENQSGNLTYKVFLLTSKNPARIKSAAGVGVAKVLRVQPSSPLTTPLGGSVPVPAWQLLPAQ